jgi:hypothetical protein
MEKPVTEISVLFLCQAYGVTIPRYIAKGLAAITVTSCT